MRFLLYSHDGAGLGHLRRNLAIAGALARLEPSAAILLAHGQEDFGVLRLPDGVDALRVPGLRKGDDGYVPRRLHCDVAAVRNLRSGVLRAAVDSFAPDVLLADKHPAGVLGELRRALTVLAAQKGVAALGLRDVLDDPARVRSEWDKHGIEEVIAQHHRAVLVYGSRDVYDPIAECGLGPAVAERARFCGYVTAAIPEVTAAAERCSGRRPRVLATVGGGEDGAFVLEAFLAACKPAQWDAVVVAGPLADPRTHDYLARRARCAGVRFHRSVDDLAPCLRWADAAVTMGGYNTVLEALAHGVAVTCVPRVRPRTEQLIRARAFAARGLLSVVEPTSLSPAAIRCSVETSLEGDRAERARHAVAVLGLDGAAVAARDLVRLAENR